MLKLVLSRGCFQHSAKQRSITLLKTFHLYLPPATKFLSMKVEVRDPANDIIFVNSRNGKHYFDILGHWFSEEGLKFLKTKHPFTGQHSYSRCSPKMSTRLLETTQKTLPRVLLELLSLSWQQRLRPIRSDGMHELPRRIKSQSWQVVL